ncbi:hypothetical protein GC089_16125 [Cellulomonas sp. JZ18]|nr:hypothetical protein GC089_16125 [Cellulomonas sp. JZ18]
MNTSSAWRTVTRLRGGAAGPAAARVRRRPPAVPARAARRPRRPAPAPGRAGRTGCPPGR